MYIFLKSYIPHTNNLADDSASLGGLRWRSAPDGRPLAVGGLGGLGGLPLYIGFYYYYYYY
jgi:hypothetical protein